MSAPRFSFFWMLGGFIYTTLFSLIAGPKRVAVAFAREWKYASLAGIFTLFWVLPYFAGIKRLDPPVGALVFNVRGIWAVAIGLVLLGERYSRAQYAGMLIILAGLTINLIQSGGPDETIGTLLLTGSALSFVLTNVCVKKIIHKTGVLPALYARFAIPLLAFAIISGNDISFTSLGSREILLLATGSFVGPFLSFILVFSSLKYVTIGMQSFFLSSGVFLTGVLSFLVFGSIPTGLQLTGGVIIVLGTIILSLIAPQSKPSRPRGEAKRP